MAKVPYIKACKEALGQPAIEGCTMSNQVIESAITFITEQLKGPIPNDERMMLIADRAELRATLKSRKEGRS